MEILALLSSDLETLTHRLILPREANHHGTLYAGSLVALALEAAYATAYRSVGDSANLVLKRVVDLRCIEPVRIGQVVQIRGVVLMARTAQVIVGLYGSPLPGRVNPWMDSIMQFVQVDSAGRPVAIDARTLERLKEPMVSPWLQLRIRLESLLHVRREPTEERHTDRSIRGAT